MGQNYYEVLEVNTDATESEIKKQYRMLAKQYHPDANPDNAEAARRFEAISEAYAVLGDKVKRSLYDAECAKAKSAGSGRGGKTTGSSGETHPRTGFEQFFGFSPNNGAVDPEKRKPKGKAKTNPIDMTEMFERYMGIKK